MVITGYYANLPTTPELGSQLVGGIELETSASNWPLSSNSSPFLTLPLSYGFLTYNVTVTANSSKGRAESVQLQYWLEQWVVVRCHENGHCY